MEFGIKLIEKKKLWANKKQIFGQKFHFEFQNFDTNTKLTKASNVKSYWRHTDNNEIEKVKGIYMGIWCASMVCVIILHVALCKRGRQLARRPNENF